MNLVRISGTPHVSRWSLRRAYRTESSAPAWICSRPVLASRCYDNPHTDRSRQIRKLQACVSHWLADGVSWGKETKRTPHFMRIDLSWSTRNATGRTRCRRGFVHPGVSKPVTISGKPGDDAKHYQIRSVRRAIEESRE